MDTIPQCDKCGGITFDVVRRGNPKFESASQYFGRSKSWFERTLQGVSNYRAMCKTCGEIYNWSVDHSLPVMD